MIHLICFAFSDAVSIYLVSFLLYPKNNLLKIDLDEDQSQPKVFNEFEGFELGAGAGAGAGTGSGFAHVGVLFLLDTGFFDIGFL